MIVSRFDTAVEFLTKTQNYLLQQECVNGLMLGICLQLQEGRYEEHPPLLMTIEDGANLTATAVRTPPHNLIVYSDQDDCQPAMTQLAQTLANETLPGVFGPSQIARTFAEIWQAQTARPYQLEMSQRVFELYKVEYSPSVPGHLHLAAASERPLVLKWVTQFYEDAFGQADDEIVQKVTDRHLNSRSLYVWADGRPVSMAVKTRETPNGRTVSLVYTPPELRGRGYATACVAALSQQLLDDGYQFCTLFTDLANPTSNHIYQKIGYKPVADFNEYLFH